MCEWPNPWWPSVRYEPIPEDGNEAQDRIIVKNTALDKENRDLKKQLEARDERIGELEKKVVNHCKGVKTLRNEADRMHLLDSEKIRRQDELLSQADKRAEETEKAHRETVNKLYNEINSLQIGPVQMNDEQITAMMRKLGHDLDAWVKKNFVYSPTEEPSNQFPFNSLQLQAWIQADITQMIRNRIFAPYYFGVHNGYKDYVIESLKDGIESTLPEKTLRMWQDVTCDFLEKSMKGNRERTMRNIMNQVDKHFGKFSSTDSRLRQHQFQELLQGCSDLKTALSRQQARYLFYCSTTGSEFSLKSMAFGGGDGELVNTVRRSLWPGLAKRCHGGTECLLEPELVWTMDSSSSDIS